MSGSVVRGLGRFFYGSVEVAQAVDRKFAVGETVDNVVGTLLQRAVATVAREDDPDAADLQELKTQRTYKQAKKVLATSLQELQELLEDGVGLVDRVMENVKKVE